MKKVKKMIIGLILLIFFSFGINAQVPPEPPGDHGSTNNQEPGGNASLVSGTILLIGLGFVYGTKRYYDLRKNNN